MSSIFTYNITRNYQAVWFTPVVVIVFIVATILCSFLNLATSGYSLITVYSTEPNQTISQSTTTLFQRWPSFMVQNTRATCESTTIPINSAFLTNNTALTYTLTGVWQDEATLVHSLGSLVYFNNPIQNCVIGSISITFNSYDRTAAQIAIQHWSVDITVYITCSIQGSNLTWINMTAEYNYLPASINSAAIHFDFSSPNVGSAAAHFNFIGRDESTKESLYWGESLLAMYWIHLTDQMYSDNLIYETQWNKGYISFRPNTSGSNDISSLDFLDVTACFFLPFQAYPSMEYEIGYCQDESVQALGSGALLPDIWMPADSLAKSFYSTVLTDLGQESLSPSNILVDPVLLEYFTRNFSLIGGFHPLGNNLAPDPALATEPYNSSATSSGRLYVPPSMIATEYLCSVPRLKSTSSLMVAIIIADLVFLRTLWQLFKLFIDSFLSSKDPEMLYCKGCLHLMEAYEGEKLSNETLETLQESKTTDGQGAYHSVDETK